MPPDHLLDEATIRTYDEVRRHFIQVIDDRVIPLFLNSFGDGSGFGVYQLVPEILARYPADKVVSGLMGSLMSPSCGVRDWSLEIANSYPDRRLLPGVLPALRAKSVSERTWAAEFIKEVPLTSDEKNTVAAALVIESDHEVRHRLKAALANEPPALSQDA